MSDDGSSVEPDWMKLIDTNISESERNYIQEEVTSKQLKEIFSNWEVIDRVSPVSMNAIRIKENVRTYIQNTVNEKTLEIFLTADKYSKSGITNILYKVENITYDLVKHEIISKIRDKLIGLDFKCSYSSTPDTLFVDWAEEKEKNASN